MVINYNDIETTKIENFKGGEKTFQAKIFTDDLEKIMLITLIPGATVGWHCHDTSSEIIYILSGTATALYDDTTEIIEPGQVHYCPKGHSHSVQNRGEEDLVFFAVVPEQ